MLILSHLARELPRDEKINTKNFVIAKYTSFILWQKLAIWKAKAVTNSSSSSSWLLDSTGIEL